MTEDTEPMGSTIPLPAVVDLAAADQLLVTLRDVLTAGQPCSLDAANVEQLLLPGVQVVLSAVRSSAKIRVINPSASFREAFEQAALSWVGDAETAPAPEGDTSAPEPTAGAAPESEAEQSAAPESAEPAARPAVKRILTIDDSKTMRDMLRLTLVGAGYDVLQAVDGQDGLDVLRKERVDVVITDINMPKLDGYGVIRHLRADAGYDETPILVLSTESDQKTKDIGRDAGATGWLVKPFDPDQLVEIVRQVSP
jgi:two-component system, chemotaxis family, chemotaxis protein CheY